ncbi:MAG: PHP domain-containing protein [Promethearchaeota archaeon]
MMIDLHLHSTASDGEDTPSELIDKSLKLGLKAIALTDHDTVDGLEEFLTYGEDKNIICIPGIELSIRHDPPRELIDVHILGLNIDYKASLMVKTLKEQLEGRLKQKEEICTRLREELGYDITYAEVKTVARGKTVGRPHIVQIMIQNNPEKVKGKTKNHLFKMISIGGIAYVDREVEVNLEEAIELIEACGGIPILAHPGIYESKDREKFVEMCVKAGIKGIEIEYMYNMNRPWVNTDKKEWAQEYFPKFYSKLADKFGLIKSGGSDYHGSKKGYKIGAVKVPDDYLKSFI